MLVIAQTNLQLFNQLCRAQWSVSDLALARSTYELAMTLFSGRFRANGKPFLAHLVGTASVLATFQQPPAVVVAGLIHSAFEYGDYGDGERGTTAGRRRRLTRCVGADVTSFVVQYHGLSRDQALRRIEEQEFVGQSSPDGRFRRVSPYRRSTRPGRSAAHQTPPAVDALRDPS